MERPINRRVNCQDTIARRAASRREMVMRKFLTALILIPLGVLFIVFAFANRHLVTVTFDPFDATDPETAVTLPLFILIIAVAIFGVVAGGVATWLRQRRWRHAARQHETDAREGASELADLRRRVRRLPRGDQQRAFGAVLSTADFTGPPGETSRLRRCRTVPSA